MGQAKQRVAEIARLKAPIRKGIAAVDLATDGRPYLYEARPEDEILFQRIRAQIEFGAKVVGTPLTISRQDFLVLCARAALIHDGKLPRVWTERVPSGEAPPGETSILLMLLGGRYRSWQVAASKLIQAITETDALRGGPRYEDVARESMAALRDGAAGRLGPAHVN